MKTTRATAATQQYQSHKDRLKAAFKQLRSTPSVFARMNFMCCTGCGCAAIPEDKALYVFYHAQDNEHAWDGDNFRRLSSHEQKRTNEVHDGLHLTFGIASAHPFRNDEAHQEQYIINWGRTIVAAIREAGLKAEWDGDTGKKIWVTSTSVPEPEIDYSYVKLAGGL